jgi:hypothetical protein
MSFAMAMKSCITFREHITSAACPALFLRPLDAVGRACEPRSRCRWSRPPPHPFFQAVICRRSGR